MRNIFQKPPATITHTCPKHGEITGTFIRLEGTDFCLKCIAEKFEELGVHELVKVAK